MPRIVPLDPARYTRHLIHGEGRTWAETNCYSDVIIELLHGLGFEPLAVLPYTLAIDFDVDQWTFFKPPPEDLAQLYALGTHELAIWRPLVDHLVEHVAAGRPVLVELDSYFLPDTAGTAYRLAHMKSTVAVNEIDPAQRRLGYFHNQGYYELSGQDFLDIFQVEGLVHPRMLPPYVEFLKPLPRARPLVGAQLLDGSLDLLEKHLRRRPEHNPFRSFRARFEQDMDWLQGAGIEVFHAYSFATLRQYGACYELASTGLRWLAAQGVSHTLPAAEAFDQISRSTKALQFQFARAMARQRPLELSGLDQVASLWEQGMDTLQRPRA